MSFADKVVIVTGASSGIGAAAAIAFCKAGASVVLVGRNGTKLKSVAEQCARAGGKHMVIKADVAKDINAVKVVYQTVADFGKLDVLVNNAGVGLFGTILSGKILEAYDGLMNVNIRAAIHLTSLATPHLVKTKGNVINITSVAGRIPLQEGGGLAYSVSKAALIHFTKGAAAELAPLGVRVNSICPGPVTTDFITNSGVDISWDQVAQVTTILKRASEPDEVADLILFLASDKARGITGSDYVLDNGMLLK